MAKDPAFLFYPNDWIGGTMGMTFEEKGVYMELLMLQFNRGHMTTHMIGQAVGQLWVNVADKFEKDPEGRWFNRRLELEQEKRRKFSESRRNNIKGANQHTNKRTAHMDGHMTSHMENENINENINNIINVPFDKFWDLYDKKVDKGACERKWAKLTNTERELAIENIPPYKASIPDKQFRKNPETYLNNKSWNNEIIKSNGQQFKIIPNGSQSKLGTSEARTKALSNWGRDAFGG